jgi:hypothetical protein
MAKKLTQKEKVLRHLQEIGAVTPVQAFFDYSIMRLAAIVFELKEDGYDIETIMLRSTNKFGEPIRYAQYKINK